MNVWDLSSWRKETTTQHENMIRTIH